jgi:hypothetical protein
MPMPSPPVALYRTSSGSVTLVPRKRFESISRYTSSYQASVPDDAIHVPEQPCHPYLHLTKKRSNDDIERDTETRRAGDRRSALARVSGERETRPERMDSRTTRERAERGSSCIERASRSSRL